MKANLDPMISSKFHWVASVALLSCLALSPLNVAAQAKPLAAPTSQPSQKTFDTPKQAADALIQAAGKYDVAALKDILGPDSTDLVTSADTTADKNRATAFAAKAKEKTLVIVDKKNPNLATVVVGHDDFELPFPIVKSGAKWSFDAKVGREEVLNRRIGATELDAIQICRGFDEAQMEYASEKHDGSKINQYAQKIVSTPGRQDGLAWKNPDGSWGGPVGELVAKALEQGYTDKSQPFHGYFFKVLKGQGPAAPLGEMDFMVNGAMIGGFALAAAPAQYRVTGVKSFMVGSNGIVYEKDLGPDSLKAFQSLDRFNPDSSWQPTQDQWPVEPD